MKAMRTLTLSLKLFPLRSCPSPGVAPCFRTPLTHALKPFTLLVTEICSSKSRLTWRQLWLRPRRNEKLTAFSESYFAKYDPNILVLFTRDRVPCGVIEVKKPAAALKQDDSITSKRFQGQMFTYLALLKSVYGVQNPLGS